MSFSSDELHKERVHKLGWEPSETSACTEGEAMSDLKEAIAKFLFLTMLEAENDGDYAVTDRDWDEFKLKHGDVKWWKKKADALLREHGLVELDKDQTWPTNPYFFPERSDAFNEAEARAHEAGFRKVKEIA